MKEDYELRNYVKDNRSGVITEMIKHKPENVTAKGVATMQLINAKTGEIDVEVRSENIVMDHFGKNAYNYAFYTRMTDMDGGVPYPFGAIHLTTWDKPEKANTPCFLGVRRAWANRSTQYVGTDKYKGTVNLSESRNYINQDGKYVMSFVFDWPTHSGNGTFNSILWTTTDKPNYRGRDIRGSIWFAPYSIDADIREYLNIAGSYVIYDEVNDYLNIIASESSSDSIPATNPYKGSYSGFRFKRGTSELIDQIRYVDQDGTSLPIYPSTARTMLSDGRTVYAYLYTSSSSSTRHKKDYYTIEIFNNEGVLTKRSHLKVGGGFPNGEGLTFSNSTTYMEKDGTLRFYGYYYNSDKKTYDNVILRYDPFNDTLLETISINKKIYIPNTVENVNSVRITSTSTGLNIATMEFTYTTTSGGSATFGGTYDVSDIRNISMLNDYYGTTYDSASGISQFAVHNTDIYMIGSSSSAYSSTTWRQSDRWGVPTAHTLLAAPVTKTQSHTMKVTYDIIIDTVDILDSKSFFID